MSATSTPFPRADGESAANLTAVPVPTAPPRALPATKSAAPRVVWERRYGWWLRVSDLFVVATVVAVAESLRFGGGGGPNASFHHTSVNYSCVSAAIVGCWVIFLAVYRTRSPGVIGAGSEELRRVWSATLSVFGAIAIVSMLFKLDIARGYLAIALPLGLVGLSVSRHAARKVVA